MSSVVEGLFRVLAALGGAYLVGSTFMSAVRTVVLPRAGSQRLTRLVFISMRYIFEFRAHPNRAFEDRDRILQLWAPLALIMLPFMWIFATIIGFTGIQWAISGDTLRDALLRSGSSQLTLGVTFKGALPNALASFVQASIGLILSALLISYLPSIYGAYQRRETLVGLLESRAGMPPSAFQTLVRYQRVGFIDEIDTDLFEKWEQWFVEMEESHMSFAALVFFRSPRPERSWITAAGCVLDTASILLSCVDRPFSGRTALCLRSGFLSLRRLSDYFSIPHNPDPSSSDSISVTRQEFDLMCEELLTAGLPLKTNRDQMWADFQGWRVNYDETLVGLAKLIVAPPGVWSSDRDGHRYVPKLGLFRRGSRIHRGGRIR